MEKFRFVLLIVLLLSTTLFQTAIAGKNTGKAKATITTTTNNKKKSSNIPFGALLSGFSGINDINQILLSSLVLFRVIYIVKKFYIDEKIRNKDLYYFTKLAIDKMLKSLDPHSGIVDDSLKDIVLNPYFGGLGIYITKQNDSLIKILSVFGKPALSAGLKPGDYILKVDDVSVINASLDECSKLLKGKIGTKVKVLIYRKSDKKKPYKTIIVTRGKIVPPNAKVKLVSLDTLYIKLISFSRNCAENLKKLILKTLKKLNLTPKNIKKIIIDLRNNGGGLLDESVKVASLFLPKGSTVVKIGTAKSKKPLKTENEPIFSNKIKIVELINANTASAAEILAGALLENLPNRAKAIGTKTFGKGSVQNVFNIGSSLKLLEMLGIFKNKIQKNKTSLDELTKLQIKLTVEGFYRPVSGKSYQGNGVKPNFEITQIEKEAFEKVKKGELENTTNKLLLREEDLPNIQNIVTNVKSKNKKNKNQKQIKIPKDIALDTKEDVYIYYALKMLNVI